MRFMYAYPETHGTERDMLDAGPVADVARTAEAAGFGGFAFTEHPSPGARWLAAGGHQSLDPFIALSYVAAVTSSMKLLTYISVVPYRNPLLLAKTAASLDKLSGGRFVLGVGTGYLKGEFKALGVDIEERNELFDEALDVLPLHWSGEPFSYKGRHFEAVESIGRPRPVQLPIPIWIGGNAKVTRERVAERAQGWMPLVVPAEVAKTARSPALRGLDEVVESMTWMRATAAERGVDLDLVLPYSDSSLAANPAQDAARHRDAFAELEAAGVTWVVVSGSTSDHAATTAFLEQFGETYLSGAT
jgi:probable F420-dependent oxidoreductase